MTTPLVSIILPTYNRAAFLPMAFDAIRGQEFRDWELLVVDDGSVDNTRELVEAFAATVQQPVRYQYQTNGGAYSARNAGLDLASGRYVAFYDSDDVWLPHHLRDCTGALEEHPEISWVYGSCRVVRYATGEVLAPSTFYESGRPRPFLSLRHRDHGPLRLIDDPNASRCMILHGLMSGLQNSVIRRDVFANRRFNTHFRNEAEDQLIVVRALGDGCRFGYFDNVHVIYHEHDQNSSAAGSDQSLAKQVTVYEAEARGYEELGDQVRLSPAERRAVRKRLGQIYFWVLGYSVLWQRGRRQEALAMFQRGLKAWPWSIAFWKTYLLAIARAGFRRQTSGLTQSARATTQAEHTP